MHLALSEDQAMIREAAQHYLAAASDSAAVRAAMDSQRGYDPAVWQAIAEQGWCGVAIDECHDGLQLGVKTLALLQEQAGYHLLCAPFFSTVCLAATLLEAGDDDARAEFLPAIAAGEMLATTPLPAAADGWEQPVLQAKQNAGHWQLQGELSRVPDAAAQTTLFTSARTDQGIGVFALPLNADGVTLTPLDGWDRSRRFHRVQLDHAGPARRCDGAADQPDLSRATARARLYIAAEQLGAAQRCLDLTVEYTGERKQFGRTIASFQAVKHRCAQMMVQIESLRSAVYGAATLADAGDDEPALQMDCNMVKALADETLFFCAAEAIQLHGGVGFTWEYDPQLFFKRAQAARHWLGNASALRARVAESLL